MPKRPLFLALNGQISRLSKDIEALRKQWMDTDAQEFDPV